MKAFIYQLSTNYCKCIVVSKYVFVISVLRISGIDSIIELYYSSFRA